MSFLEKLFARLIYLEIFLLYLFIYFCRTPCHVLFVWVQDLFIRELTFAKSSVGCLLSEGKLWNKVIIKPSTQANFFDKNNVFEGCTHTLKSESTMAYKLFFGSLCWRCYLRMQRVFIMSRILHFVYVLACRAFCVLYEPCSWNIVLSSRESLDYNLESMSNCIWILILYSCTKYWYFNIMNRCLYNTQYSYFTPCIPDKLHVWKFVIPCIISLHSDVFFAVILLNISWNNSPNVLLYKFSALFSNMYELIAVVKVWRMHCVLAVKE